MAAFERFADFMLSHLLWTSLQAVVLVAVIVLILRLLPRLPAAARCALWWLVALQVVLGLASSSPIRLPLLASPVAVTVQLEQHVASAGSAAGSGSTVASSVVRGWGQRISWREGLLALWVFALLAQTPALLAERRRLRALLRDARDADPPLQRRCVELARLAGLRRCPRLRVSERVTAPLVAGWWRPLILWPDRQALSAHETSLALAHELAHLKRGDLWLGVVPALARRLLFFHPLVRWAVHEYAAYREAACDAVAVRGQADSAAQGYGALLLRLGVSDPRIAGISAASGTFRNLKLRLTMLRQPADAMLRMRVWILIVAVAMLGALPYRVVAANKAAVVRDNAAADPARGAGELPTQCGVKADDISFCGANFLAYMGAPRDGQGAVLFDKGHVIIAGKHADVVAAKRYYRPGARMLWFRDGNQAYLSRDPALLARADALLAPVSGRYKKAIALNGGLGKLHQHLEMLNERVDRLRQGLDVLHQRQALLDRKGVRADPKERADLQVREAVLIASIQTQQAQINGVQRSLDAQQMALQRWQRMSSGTFAALRTGLGKLADGALASGSTQVVD
ncbi:MAG TPA: M56 family metallopeptidase [Rhodanobacteraceae bacterium]|nr:M56 family metallopeptidase [Rhodanobacteraceae bacterium]